MKLGHVFLFVVYTSSFAVSTTISKDVFYTTETTQHVSFQEKQKRMAESIANSIADKIGMTAFFEELNKGM